MAFTRLAVLFATSLALCTKCLLATGLDVLDDASRHALHNDDVCLATMVAADRTCRENVNMSQSGVSILEQFYPQCGYCKVLYFRGIKFLWIQI